MLVSSNWLSEYVKLCLNVKTHLMVDAFYTELLKRFILNISAHSLPNRHDTQKTINASKDVTNLKYA